MRLTKAKQKQLDEAYDTLIQVCLYDRPLKDMEPFLADDVMNFGAGRKELTKTKTAFLRQIKNQKKLAAGLKMDFQFKPVLRKIINKGDGAIYTDDIVNTVWVSGVKNKLKFRLSFIFEYRDRKWIMVHSHTSTPDSQRSDDEVWPVEELKKRTEVLEKSLDEKIAELEVKNRELEIEAALEKVRSRSLAMHNSDELQDVINCVFDRLNELSIVTDTASILITHDNSKDYDSWIQNSDRSYSSKVLIPNAANTISLDTQAARESVKDFSKIYNKKEKDDFFDNLFKNSDLKNLPDHRKKLIAEAEYYSVCCVNAKNAGIFFARYNDKQFSEKERETLKRFVRVFEQSYIRFIDLQKAEAQAREAQIEAALEKVRSRSLAMHNANELGEVVTVIVEKLKDLGVVLDANGVVLCTYFQNSKDVMHWIVSTDYSMAGSYLLPYFDHPIFNAAWQSKENGDEYFSRAFSVAEKNSFFEHAFEHSDYRHFPDEFKQWIFQNDQHILSFAWQKNSAILIPSHTGVLPSEEDIAILKRFAKVFEQSYVRFLDLQKAEAQAREAQIQLALERVRARTMAMHHSDELTDVVKLLYQEFDKLKISNESTDIEIGLIDEKTGIASVWAHLYLSDGTISTFKFPVTHFDEVRKEFEEWKATPLKKRNELFFTMDLSRERWQDFVDIAVQLPELSEIFKPLIEAKITKWVTHNAYFSHGFLTLQGTEAYSPQTQEIQKRFAKVFEQTYTRFLDLQKAEAQAKEAQIELGLERVRARAMAMQSSDELKELIGTVFIELTKLDIVLTRCLIMIYDTVSNDSVWWMANSEAPADPIGLHIKYHEHAAYLGYINAWRKKNLKWVYVLEGADKKSWDDFLFAETELSHLPDFVIEGMKAPDRVYLNSSFNTFGNLTLASLDPLSDEHFDILLRFAKVFDLTYTRFSDLQKAEAQAREAKIEAALERVRAKVMAMKSSGDLNETSLVFGEQLRKLGIDWQFSYFWLIEEDKDDNTFWITWPDNQTSTTTYSLAEADESFRECIIAWQQQVKIHSSYIPVPDVPAWLDTFERITKDAGGAALEIMRVENFKDGVYYYDAMIKFGSFGILTNRVITEDEKNIQYRFAVEFERAYTRFLDLQKAEAQAREAQIEAALERVRSRTMAMHTSDELLEVIIVVSDQLQQLNFKFDNVSFGVNSPDYDIKFWMAVKARPHPILCNAPFIDNPVINRVKEAQKKGRGYLFSDILTPEENRQWIHHLYNNADVDFPEEVKNFLLSSPGYSRTTIILNNIFFFIGNYSAIPYTDEENSIFNRFANVFEQSYTRFLDLQKAEAQAREAQIEAALERVRSRTMAMHKSDELSETAVILFKQLHELGNDPHGFSIDIIDDAAGIMNVYATDQDGHELNIRFESNFAENITVQKMYKGWKAGLTSDVIHLKGKDLDAWTKYVREKLGLSINVEHFKGQRFHNVAYFSQGWLNITTLEPVSQEAITLLERFASVFNLTYRRFLDLQRAEAQAKEAQIEAALERVRAKAMAMHSSEHLAETIKVFYHQLGSLSLTPRRCGVGLINREAHKVELSSMNTTEKGDSIEVIGTLNLTGHPVLEGIYDHWLLQLEYRPVLRGKEIKEYNQLVRPQIAYPDYPSDTAQYGYFFFFNEGGVYAWTEKEMTDDELQIYRRFTSVLSLTYKRYKDLQQAEANAREAQIEAALERVRARSMAMHKSDELLDVISVVAEQLLALNFKFDNVSFGINLQDYGFNFWLAATGQSPVYILVPYLDNPAINRILDARQKDIKFFADTLTREENRQWIQHVVDHSSFRFPSEEIKEYLMNSVGYSRSSVILKSIMIFIGNYRSIPFTDEENAILIRFANVFEQSYTRFLDLQKAEAQTREATIEASLERVRSKAMAMHNSADLAETIKVFYQQMELLNLMPRRCGVGLIDKESHIAELTGMIISEEGDAKEIAGKLKLADHPVLMNIYEYWVLQKEYHPVLRGNEIKEYYELIGSQVSLQNYPDDSVQFGYFFFFSDGTVYAWTEKEFTEDELKIYRRFTSVLSLTYKRYKDLKQAEAQAREAKIEAAMEKVRARAMAMQKPDELVEVAELLRKEMGLLGVEELETSSIYIHNETSGKTECWFAMKDSQHEKKLVADHMTIDLTETGVGRQMMEFYHSNEKQISIVMQGAKRKEWINYCAEHSKVFGSSGFYGDNIPDRTYHLYKFSNGYIGAASPGGISAESWGLLQRATTVFSLAYTRFNDLQQAEANAKEAVKQAALDRVRAEIASMRTVNDLEKITPLIWNELTVLGIPFIRCGVFIMDESQKLIHTFLSTPDGKAIGAFHLPYDTPENIVKILDHWREKKRYIDHWDEAIFTEFAHTLVKQGALASPEQYLKTTPHGGFHLHFLPFLQGMLYVGNTTRLSEDEIKLIQSVADAFSTAYARYEDFNKLEAAKQQVDRTLTDLKQAQTQLVQSEKMASLGELTAGIAHEIQNPLNFVNNFSDVSNELLEEMRAELQKGNKDDAMAIVDDVKQNLEKILHHGKRADAIVKGMLQHSRTSSGQKELTDINLLADEYLRLAYHGLRAKDKSFNAKFETVFDDRIGKINIIPQEMGRVILNLINNGFYAVNEKKKQFADARRPDGQDYEPTVTISTLKDNGKVEIKVRDNGIGIPQKMLDKIFQPFFTTKPTGEGTGLGLSLAYDIVKAHGGELKVETSEGEGSEFVIQLPVI